MLGQKRTWKVASNANRDLFMFATPGFVEQRFCWRKETTFIIQMWIFAWDNSDCQDALKHPLSNEWMIMQLLFV